MKRKEKLAAFSVGFTGYPLLELLWRGRTHWSMALAGGVVSLLIYPLCIRKKGWMLCLRIAAVITGVELVFGCIFNLLLKMNVWDYSKKPLNLWGQICLPYCMLWFLLGYPLRLLFCGLHKLLKRM